MAEAVEAEKDAPAEEPAERPLKEAIRNGPTWIAALVSRAFENQFRSDGGEGGEFLWLADFGPDYILIESNHPDLKPGQLLKVPFTIKADDSVTFPERGEWQVVEMTPTVPPAGRGEIAEESADEEQAEPGVAEDEPAESEPVVESDLPSQELGTSEEFGTREQLGAAETAEVEPGEGTPAEVEPSAEEPGETIPAEVEPSAEEPGETIPAEVEPGEEEPGETIPSEVEPSAEEPDEAIPAEVEQSAEEPGEETPSEAEPSAEEPDERIPAEVLEAAENDYAGQGRKIRESFDDGVTLVEAAEGQPRRIRGLLITADVVGINGRRYGHAVLQEAVAAGQRHLRESMSQGRAVLLGEAEHPTHKGGRPMFLETIVVWESLDYDTANRQVWIEGRLIENTRGKDAIATMEAGVLPGLSLRGRGMTRTVTEEDNEFEDVIWVRFTGFDLVLNPSFADSAVTVLESDQAESSADVEAAPERELGTEPPNEENVMEPESTPAVEAVDLEAEKTKWTAEMQETAERQAEADRQAAEATETKKKLARLAELEEANARHEAENWLAEAMEEIDYPKNIRVRFEGMIGEPTTLEEAQRSFASAKEMVDAFIADMRLRSRGMTVENGVDVVGPVIEQADDSAPGFAAPAAAIAESIAQHRGKMRSDLANPRNINERLGRDYIARYDELYAHKLIQEAREWAEAETTTQLNLPYSVTRAVIEEAFPELIAASVFDVGVVNQSPLRIWYNQAFEGEAGSYGSITDESFTSSHDAWVSLAHKRITFGGVVITTNPAGTTYVEGTDYVIDYVEGRIKVLSTGSMADATGFLADYAYKEYRKGEGLGIERARTTLSFVTVDAAADRLATQITAEAVAFSRSQLGLDIVAGNINALLKDLLRTVDGNLFGNALSEALAVANNSGGTWTSGSDAISKLVEYIGVAKVKIANRYNNPSAVVMSLTNADRLSNSDMFTAAGARADAALDAAGYVGRVKGLNAFASTEFTDSYILVCDRQLVLHRVFQPMQLKGPFPVIDSSQKQVPSEEYYAEEFNVTAVPVPGKGATVKIS